MCCRNFHLVNAGLEIFWTRPLAPFVRPVESLMKSAGEASLYYVIRVFFLFFSLFLTSSRGIIRINSGKSCLKPRFEQGNFVCLLFIIIRIAARTKCCNWIFSFLFLSLLLPLSLFLSLNCSINIPPGVAWSLIEKWKIGRDWWWSDYQLDVQINPAKSRYKS